MTDIEAGVQRTPGDTFARVLRVTDALALAGGWAGMACLVLISALMLAQVGVAFASKFTTSVRGDIPIAWEYGSYMMGAAFLLGSGMTLRADRHIRLGVVVQNCGPRMVRVLEIVSSALALCFTVFLTWSLAGAAHRAILMGTVSISSGTPLWIPQSVFALGTALLALQFAMRLACAIARVPVASEALRFGGELDE